jgi:c-di-GMP-related signal transduction protein
VPKYLTEGERMKKFKTESERVLEIMVNSIYTNKEIFLRELLSNASDAIDKLYYKSLKENLALTKSDYSIRIEADEKSRILFASVLQMLTKIGITTVVEGVETQEQSELARSLGADMIQGYHHAQPMTEKDFVSFMRNQAAEEARR